MNKISNINSAECNKCRLWILYWSLVVIILSTIIRIIVGNLCGSRALIASAICSFVDCIIFGINYTGASKGRQGSVWQSTLIASLMFVLGAGVCADNILILISDKMAHPGLLALAVAVLFVILSCYFYKVSVCTNEVIDDDHNILLCRLLNRSNFYCSCLAFIGIVLAECGVLFLDPVCGVIIGCIMIKESYEIYKLSFTEQQPLAVSVKRLVMVFTGILCFCIMGFYMHAITGVLSSRLIILIPSQGMQFDSQADSVLGRAGYFAIIDTKNNEMKAVLNINKYSQNDVSVDLLAIIKANNVGVVLAQNIGEEMFYDLKLEGIRTYLVDKPGTIMDTLSSYQNGQFKKAAAPNVIRGFGRSRIRWLSPW